MPTWIEVLSTDEKNLARLAAENNVHPLALEDCQHRDQRPKLDDYDGHQLLVWFMFAKGRVFELQFIIFSDKLICVPHEAPPAGGTWKDYLRINESTKDVWHLLYQALDHSADITWQEMLHIFSEIDAFESEILNAEIDTHSLLQFKKLLNRIDYSVGHLASVAKQVQNLCQPTGDLKWKFRDLYDHCERFTKSIDLYRSQISSSIDLYWGVQANRTNRQMKKLTLLASVAIPLTFWASFWGMNFEAIPFNKKELFFVALIVMALSVAGTLWLLIKQGLWKD